MTDYKNTLFLPQTDFSMRAGLKEKEPELLKFWKENRFFDKMQERCRYDRSFVLHDGPPYANGHLHLGHGLNKILKDFVCRSQYSIGKKPEYILGWDCHGLPIEWQVEIENRAKGIKKEDLSPLEFRAQCRAFAAKWVTIQKEEFRRLGLYGLGQDQDYQTMNHEAEAKIAEVLLKFADEEGLIYQAHKPVLWSITEQTALAEAEVEYKTISCEAIYVKFSVIHGLKEYLETHEKTVSVVIWTTTPWTLPGNAAIAFSSECTYGLYEVTGRCESSAFGLHELFIVAAARVDDFAKKAGIDFNHQRDIDLGTGEILCAHPLRNMVLPNQSSLLFYAEPVRIFSGDFVTDKSGTGLVHIAPAHGLDDYALMKKYKFQAPIPDVSSSLDYTPTSSCPLSIVDESGMHLMRGFEGKRIGAKNPDDNADSEVIRKLKECKNLVAQEKIEHAYPHSWRSKMPLIYRATPQWFVRLGGLQGQPEVKNLKEKALKALDSVHFHPYTGKNRLTTMVKNRPDWCISRQRVWGTPLPFLMFINDPNSAFPVRYCDEEWDREREKDSKTFCPDVSDKGQKEDGCFREEGKKEILTLFKKEGADAWFTHSLPKVNGTSANLAKVMDIVDVWFDSGVTHEFVLGGKQADLYLEGSDQHRGWFQSSLLTAVALHDRAPYKNLVTHGFVVSEDGEKMSKSSGNGLSVVEFCDQYGADVLRMWVMSCDYTDDLKMGAGIIEKTTMAYRRFRNVLRWLLGNITQKTSEEVLPQELSLWENWMRGCLLSIHQQIKDHVEKYEFRAIFSLLNEFCASSLSAFYFDISKDLLYCGRAVERAGCIQVLCEIFEYLVAWLTPFLPFLAEDAWTEYKKVRPQEGALAYAVCRRFSDLPHLLVNESLVKKAEDILPIRSAILKEIEEARVRGDLTGSALEVHVDLKAPCDLEPEVVEWMRICLVSSFSFEKSASMGVTVSPAQGVKCPRCWKIHTHVHEHSLCQRCVVACG